MARKCKVHGVKAIRLCASAKKSNGAALEGAGNSLAKEILERRKSLAQFVADGPSGNRSTHFWSIWSGLSRSAAMLGQSLCLADTKFRRVRTALQICIGTGGKGCMNQCYVAVRALNRCRQALLFRIPYTKFLPLREQPSWLARLWTCSKPIDENLLYLSSTRARVNCL